MHKIHLERIKKDEIETFLDADDYKILTEEYKDAKKHALSTPHLTKLAQKFFREELHVEETNTDRLMKYVQATGLMDDTELSIEISSKRRMTERLESISSRNEKKKKEWSEKYGLQPL
ncbi:hypothetical protein G6F56_012187 [Rhizopus delemar]|nr:hypothetical protein G6F56_012187 [Rhizopus delemar]